MSNDVNGYLTFAGAIRGQSEALYDRAEAYAKADREIRAIRRRQDLYDGEKDQRIREVWDRMAREVHASRLALKSAQQQARQLARPEEDTPDSATVQRLSYYRQEANDAMRGRDASTAVALAQKVVKSGNKERARAFVEAARPVAQETEWAGQWQKLERATEPQADRVERELHHVCDQMELRVGVGLDMGEKSIAERVGWVDPRVEEGLAEEQPLNTRKISLLARNLPQMTADAINRLNGEGSNDADE